MRTITTTYNVYSYDELSNMAKEKVKDFYLEGQLPEIFTDDCLYRLKELFPNSDLQIQYSLSYCQGDGLNIYGEIYLDEVLEKVKEKFTKKELRFFRWLFNRYGSSFKLEYNRHYCYCICSNNDFIGEYWDNMEYEKIKNIPVSTLEKFDKIIGKYLDNICQKLEKVGYDYFYAISEEELKDWCDCNDYKFYENGKIAV